MPLYNGKFYSITESRLLRPFLRSPFASLAIHWTFQGILYMDHTERLFKLALDLLLTSAIAVTLFSAAGQPLLWAVVLAYGAAHTVNLLVNGQIWVVLKHFNLVSHTRGELEAYVGMLAGHIRVEPSIVYAAAYGSLARGSWKATSDLDVRLVRRPGLWSGIRACCFALGERARANWSRFPLDMYVLDSFRLLERVRPDEKPIVLFNAHDNPRILNDVG